MAITFTELFLEYTKNYESSNAFWKWAAYSCIASVLRDNCYTRTGGGGRIYPNIYVLLLAISGAHRKGRPINIANTLVEKVGNTKVIAGRTTVQAIIKEMHSSETDPLTGKMAKGGAAVFFGEELAAGIVSDEQGVGIMTDIYDFKPKYVAHTIGGGKRVIENMVFSMFAGSNEELLKIVFTSAAAEGGLLARTFLVVPDEFRPSNSLLSAKNMPTDEDFERIYKSLRHIATTMKGEFSYTPQAEKEYDCWYGPFRESQKAKHDRTGVLGRIHTGVLKLAMILAANENSLLVGKHHIERAIAECLALLPNYNAFTLMTTKTDDAAIGALVLQHLINCPNYSCFRKILIQTYWNQGMNNEALDKAILTFELAEMIKSGVNSKREIFYVLTQKCLEIMGRKD